MNGRAGASLCFREQLARTDAVERLFARFDALLRARGWLAMSGQIPGSSPGTDRDNTASDVWADTAYHLAVNLALLERRGLKPQFQRKKPRGRKMPAHVARGNATRTRVRSRVEHVFAAQKCRLGLVVRTIDLVRARTKIGLANLAYNFARLAWLGSWATTPPSSGSPDYHVEPRHASYCLLKHAPPCCA